MKIVYVVPGPMDNKEAKRRENLLKEWVFPSTEVEVRTVTTGPASIESMYEEYLSIPETAKLMVEAEREGVAGAVLGCAGDPGLDAYRELTKDMVIMGPGAVGMHAAVLRGSRFSVLTVMDSTITSVYDLVDKAGLRSKFVSVRAVNIPVLDLAKDREGTLAKLVEYGKKVLEDGADCIVLGCMSMGFLEVAEDMEKELGVPVINPAKVAIKMTEAFAHINYTHSKKAFHTPPKIANGKVKSLDELLVSK
ncbi:aspartate/glutamate racemase family protein [Paenisporosarcina sp. TG20]|uniref:aspartate/glutamate racemase family protein n=1 Tax=Paenisporosarcina sp. TG20 TaxID=1211706 RepID=UPI0002DAAC3D|nr:aspartate/glutamate racemase family protein [Paenisporosarcina sp. TG20]